MPRRKSSKKSLSEAVSSTMQELVAAALCYGAVSHPTYRDSRKELLTQQAEARLRKAAAKYHGVVVERTAA